jgi:hypothetical protein
MMPSYLLPRLANPFYIPDLNQSMSTIHVNILDINPLHIGSDSNLDNSRKINQY